MSNVDELREKMRGIINAACVDGYADDWADAAIKAVLEGIRGAPVERSETNGNGTKWTECAQIEPWKIDALLKQLED